MLYDENEMLEICQKYGIETVEKEGYPLDNGHEMTDNFSMMEIMNGSNVNLTISENIYSGFIPMHSCFIDNCIINTQENTLNNYCCIQRNQYYNDVTSVIDVSGINSNAA